MRVLSSIEVTLLHGGGESFSPGASLAPAPFVAAGGQVQHASDQLPVSYNTAASRFQNWAKSNEASISKTAVDVFSFARAVLKPLEAEVDRKAEADKKPAAGG